MARLDRCGVERDIEPEAGLVKHVFALAKSTDHLLSDEEIRAAIAEFQAGGD